ncbi:glycosyltransferase [Shouchella hunanensis]|uniref:Glycosyltransferase n=1 Tax=Shouchella hunanensis TaxID=766894 RepID=A0ABY7WDY1_9BACI|nr:glycosyltransferase [Shouchella hunanensis]WDF05878.1 glycosyltransferase [Shouchella hunanensis]
MGTQKFKMNRVINQLDLLYESGYLSGDEVYIQRGHSMKSKYFPSDELIDKSKFDEIIEKSDIVICHGGTSSIITALNNGKKVLSIPRKANLGEHVDDHQHEIVTAFSEAGYIEVLTNINKLEETLNNVLDKEYKRYEQNNRLAKFILDNIIKN